MNSYLSTRMGRGPVGDYGSSSSMATSPTTISGGIQANVGSSGGQGVGMVLLVAAAGLTVFYVATRAIQGSR